MSSSSVCRRGSFLMLWNTWNGLSDNEVQFKFQAFNNLMFKYGINPAYSAANASQGNASERVDRSVLFAIKAYIHPNQKNWDQSLSKMYCSFRSSFRTALNNNTWWRMQPCLSYFGAKTCSRSVSFSFYRTGHACLPGCPFLSELFSQF